MFIWQLQSVSSVGMALELKLVIETSLMTVDFNCIAIPFTVTKQLYISNMTNKALLLKSGCGLMHIKVFKRRADLSYSQMASGY